MSPVSSSCFPGLCRKAILIRKLLKTSRSENNRVPTDGGGGGGGGGAQGCKLGMSRGCVIADNIHFLKGHLSWKQCKIDRF